SQDETSWDNTLILPRRTVTLTKHKEIASRFEPLLTGLLSRTRDFPVRRLDACHITILFSTKYRRRFFAKKGTNLLSCQLGLFSLAFGGFCGELGQYQRISRGSVGRGLRPPSSFTPPRRGRTDAARAFPRCHFLSAPGQPRRFTASLSVHGNWRHPAQLLLRSHGPGALPRHA